MQQKLSVFFAAIIGTALTTAGTFAQTTSMPATIPAATEPASTQAAVPKELSAAIQNGIDLLKAGKNKEAIAALIRPQDLAKAKADGTFDDQVDKFVASGRCKDLLTALQTAQHQQPKLNNAGDTFTFDNAGTDHPPLEFFHIENGWYIR